MSTPTLTAATTDDTSDARSAPGALGVERGFDDDLAAVESAIDEYFAVQAARARAHGEDYRLLWSAARDGAAGGKRMRPRAVLASFRALAAERHGPIPDAIAVAAAFELLHTAFLMHDDVIDHDDTRRGAPNVTGRFSTLARSRGTDRTRAHLYGEASAILAGDLLIAAAHRMVAGVATTQVRRERLLDLFDECVFAAAAGEHADVRFSIDETPTVGDILAMIEHKTASYTFSAPLQAGAILAGADARVIDALGDLGRDLGVAFQLRDDVLGVFGEERVTGKTAIGDLREGKQTLLIARARTDAAWAGVAGDFGRADLDERGADAIRAVIVSSGALALVEDLIDARRRAAVDVAEQSGMPRSLVAEIAALAHACGERNR
ncbi:polyprenyl synthetase family protein [Agromyces sp. LHK192]|uniref:polyprenyl synthetase family protein n=1 Tax=Agromyces sp. LHK192 TaxID=2498704 RepID=UPI000FDC2165|nr:polyprenyl synthetase family protein [Agromyces sp. LHK192]